MAIAMKGKLEELQTKFDDGWKILEHREIELRQDLLTLSDRVVNITMVVDAMEEDFEAIQSTGGGETKALKLVDIAMTFIN